jgi:hypothetical protein
MKKLDMTFTNTTVKTVGKYPSNNASDGSMRFADKYAPCKALHTLGEWENKAGKFKGEMFVNGEDPFAHENCLDVGGKFKLIHHGEGERWTADLFQMIGEFKPVYSYYMEGDESVDTMSWEGKFMMFGVLYSWKGECVWTLSQFISDMLEFYHVIESTALPKTTKNLKTIIHDALEKEMGAHSF